MMTTANGLAVRRALEAAGVEFIDENGGGPGVCSFTQGATDSESSHPGLSNSKVRRPRRAKEVSGSLVINCRGRFLKSSTGSGA
jgi:hypothetical protein